MTPDFEQGGKFYVIWSEEHGAWWLPAKMGYTRSLAAAGHYPESEAEGIVRTANRYLVPDQDPPFNEIALLDPR